MASDQFGDKRDPFLEYMEAVEGIGPQTTLFELLDDEELHDWQCETGVLIEHVDPPYDRDHLLPGYE